MNQTESGADVEKDMDAALFILIKKRANAAVHLPFLPCIQIYKVRILQIGNDFFCICAHRVEVLFGGHKANPQAIANKLEFEVFHAGT